MRLICKIILTACFMGFEESNKYHSLNSWKVWNRYWDLNVFFDFIWLRLLSENSLFILKWGMKDFLCPLVWTRVTEILINCCLTQSENSFHDLLSIRHKANHFKKSFSLLRVFFLTFFQKVQFSPPGSFFNLSPIIKYKGTFVEQPVLVSFLL